MGKQVYQDPAAEREATSVGQKFMNSTDVVGDMSRAYGTDLHSVRIHTDSGAAHQAAERGVDAFSTGRDVFFGRDAFHPEDPASRGLLAHELTHSLQQGVGGDGIGMAQSAPMGAEQGGFLDTLRQWFGRRQEEPKAQWVNDEEAYGPVNPENISDEPGMDHPLLGMLHETERDGLAQAPIFETHVITPRESDDGISPLGLHSFAGLRFTHRDPYGRGIKRQHVRFGFGGGGLRNDWDYPSDVSTETPITMHQLEELFREIPRLGAKPYKLLSYNCADFVSEVSKIAGASLPAEYHAGVLGPASAYKAAAKAATKGEQDRTHFFQGGTLLRAEGMLSMNRRGELMSGFFETAKVAARRDLTPFMLYAKLRENAMRMQEAAKELEPYMDLEVRGNTKLENAAGQQALENILRDINERGRELVETDTLVSHPRVNMVTMKTMAMAKEVERAYFPKRNLVYSEEQRATLLRAVESKTPEEIRKNREFIALKRQARMEGKDPNEVARPEVKNSDYFINLTSDVLSSGDWQEISVVRKEMEGLGELFLEAGGLTPEGVLRGALVKEDGPAQVADMMEQIRQGLSTGNQGLINSYLEQYIGQHPFLDTSQMAGTLAQMILQQLYAVSEKSQLAVQQDLHGFKMTVGSVAMLRERGSLDNTKGPAGETVKQQRGLPGGAKIADALMTHNQIERFFKEKLDAIAAEQARQRQLQQMMQNEANQGGQEPMMGQRRNTQA